MGDNNQAPFHPPFAKNASCPSGRQCGGVVVGEKVPHRHGGDPHGGSLGDAFFYGWIQLEPRIRRNSYNFYVEKSSTQLLILKVADLEDCCQQAEME